MGGFIGNFTEAWGCPSRVWNWTETCYSIWMVFDPVYGYPIEIVIAYFAAGFWIGKVACVLFEPQIEETLDFYQNKGYKEKMNVKLAIAIIIDVVGTTILLIEPLYTQPMLLTMVGTNIFLTLPKETMMVVLPFAFVTGCAGFFFENFACGIIPGFSVWVYDPNAFVNAKIPIYMIGVAPHIAFIAYAGTGLVLFGSVFAFNWK